MYLLWLTGWISYPPRRSIGWCCRRKVPGFNNVVFSGGPALVFPHIDTFHGLPAELETHTRATALAFRQELRAGALERPLDGVRIQVASPFEGGDVDSQDARRFRQTGDRPINETAGGTALSCK